MYEIMYHCTDIQEQARGKCRQDKRVRQSREEEGKKRTVEYRVEKMVHRYPNLGANFLDPTMPFRAGAERCPHAFLRFLDHPVLADAGA